MESDVKQKKLVTIADLELFKLEMVTAIRQILTPTISQKEKKWVKSSEARKILGVSPGKLQLIRDSGMLPFTRIGGNIYYEQDELYQLFEKGKKFKK
jgi:hypothetical protein